MLINKDVDFASWILTDIWLNWKIDLKEYLNIIDNEDVALESSF